MLKFVERRTAWWPFTLYVRGEDGGVFPADIRLKFVLPDSLEVIDLDIPALIEPEAYGNLEVLRAQLKAQAGARIDAIANTIVDWDGVADETGVEKLPYSRETMCAILRWPEVPEQVLKALGACLRVESAGKNSDAPVPGGPAAAEATTAI